MFSMETSVILHVSKERSVILHGSKEGRCLWEYFHKMVAIEKISGSHFVLHLNGTNDDTILTDKRNATT